MSKHKITRAERRRAEKKALKLLQSPNFLNKFVSAVKRAGLVGEEQNALVLLIVVVSRILKRPLNLFVRGRSSGGKNFLVTRVLRLLPRSAVAEITSASDKAWNYSGSAFRHRVLYVQEQNEDAGTIDPIRLLISEGELVRIVTSYENGKRVTKRLVARGPVAAISTTTKNRLQIDDETRHVSIWVDESADQTRNISKMYTREVQELRREELKTWHAVQRQIELRTGVKVVFPEWFEQIADRLFVGDLRVRRYYPAFAEACRAMCLIRSFHLYPRGLKHKRLEVQFSDFAITALIFDSVFVESLHLGKGVAEATRRLVEELCAAKGRPVQAKDIVKKLGVSMDQAYRRLRYAQKAGVIQQANRPQKSNRKTFLALPRPRFVPDPEKLFKELKLKDTIRFVHPITGKWIVYRRKRD